MFASEPMASHAECTAQAAPRESGWGVPADAVWSSQGSPIDARGSSTATKSKRMAPPCCAARRCEKGAIWVESPRQGPVILWREIPTTSWGHPSVCDSQHTQPPRRPLRSGLADQIAAVELPGQLPRLPLRRFVRVANLVGANFRSVENARDGVALRAGVCEQPAPRQNCVDSPGTAPELAVSPFQLQTAPNRPHCIFGFD